MLKIFTILSLFSASLILSSCDHAGEPAQGLEDEIYVVADSAEFEQLKPALESAFEKIIYTPQPEKLFILKRVSPNQVESNGRKKNMIIIAPLNSGSNASKFINAVIDSSVKQKIINGQIFEVKKYDLWAKNQLVMLLTAPDIEQLEAKILEKKDNLIYAFQDISDKRLYESLYNEKYERKDIEGTLLNKYGWVIYVQSDCKIAMDKPDDNFVWLRRMPDNDMERWVFIHWIDNASPAYLNEDSIRAIRNRVTAKYYKSSDNKGYAVIAEDYFMTNEINFNGRYALMTQGLWESTTKAKDGPFINYTFYDEDTKRLYMLDGAIFASKYYKRNLIQQIDVTLQSFMTEKELNKDKKENLQEAASEYNPGEK